MIITVGEIWTEIQKVIGTCDEAATYAKINEAIEELSNLGNWDPMVINLDICTQGCEITLPDDVEVPLAINVGGRPSDFRNKWFEFHLNGPGSECCPSACTFAWQDRGDFPTFRDPVKPSKIAAYPQGPEDASAFVRVYGFDDCEKWIMSPDCNGVLQDGFEVPVLYGMGSGMTSPYKVKRITRVSKSVTNSFVKLVALDPGNSSGGTLLGIFRPYITEPSFRRITVSGNGTDRFGTNSCSCTTWVRMKARRRTFKVNQFSDSIPLHSVTALKQMAMAIRKYEDDLLTEYAGYMSAAKAALEREQKSRSGPNQIKIQFQGAYAGSGCNSGNMI